MYKLFVIFLFAVGACQGETPKPVYCTGIPSNCKKYTCTLKSAGWLEDGTQKINKNKVEAYFDKYAKDHPGFKAAVQALKTTCLSGNLLPQGVYLDCPAYDLSHCIFASFLKNSGGQWLQSEACQATRRQVEACTACPEECYAPAIPIGSCNACFAAPASG